MRQRLTSLLLVFWVLLGGSVTAASTADRVETRFLLVRDNTGQLAADRLESLAGEAQTTLQNILRFWRVLPRVRSQGKIWVEFDHALGQAHTSVFIWAEERGRRMRGVRVFGIDPSLQLAHKLTHAVFMHPDKLIRNMFGIASESRFGNRDSSPMCGFDNDSWVRTLIALGEYMPLQRLGPDHDTWGMEVRNDQPHVLDRALHHAAYAEAGAFAEYLIHRFGVARMKDFYRLSLRQDRPWQAAFGQSLPELERAWLEQLEASVGVDSPEVVQLRRLRADDPVTACDQARRLAAGARGMRP
jgi:hypothetical protein